MMRSNQGAAANSRLRFCFDAWLVILEFFLSTTVGLGGCGCR
jgi:hypothetical protein